MQKTEHLARLLRRSSTRGAFYLGAVLLMLAGASVFAEEPFSTPPLSMADHQPPAEMNVLPQTNLMSGCSNSLFNLRSGPPAMSRPKTEVVAERFELPSPSALGDSLRLVHEKRAAASPSSRAFSVQAGYGRIWDESSMLQKISAGHQEVGCAYVAANISF